MPVKAAGIGDLGGLKMRWNKSEQFIVENLYIFE